MAWRGGPCYRTAGEPARRPGRRLAIVRHVRPDEVPSHRTERELRDWPAFIRWMLRPGVFWSAFALVALLRWWTIAILKLVPDEAYYWVWSRHLSWSYFDHPPMVAWLIRASTSIVGTSEAAVRLPGAILSLASIPVVMWGAGAITADRDVKRLAGLILLLNPVPALAGSIATPDAPVWFFGTASIAAACHAAQSMNGAARRWLGFGVLLGLAFLSKYTAALIGPAVFLALVSRRDGRRHLVRPWFWIGAATSLAVFLPVIAWNAKHGWASFAFQLGHGFNASSIPPWKGVGEFAGGMMLAWSPVMFILSVGAVGAGLRGFAGQSAAQRCLLACIVVPLCLFTVSATRRRVEVNWPLLVAMPAAVLTCAHIASGSRARRRLGEAGVVVSALMTLGVQSPPLVLAAATGIGHLRQLFGYEELAREAVRAAQGRPVFANRYQDAAELSFYAPGRPDVRPLNLKSRPNAYDYFSAPPDLRGVRSAVLVNVPEEHLPEGLRVASRVAWPTVVGGRTLRTDHILIVSRTGAE